MKKLLIRYFLWLSVILLGGYSQLYASHGAVMLSTSGDHVKQEQQGYDVLSLDNSVALINYTTLHFEKQNDKIENSNNEEEEEELSIRNLNISKKDITLDKHFSNSYYASVPELFYRNLAKRLPDGKLFLHSLSSKRYILFRVIRI